VNKVFRGYIALIREALGLHNDGSFLLLPAGPLVLILICGIIGSLRNVLSVSLDVLPGFYSFYPDILWTMFNFPVHLFLFPGALLHVQLQRLGFQNVRVEAIYGLSFYLQIIHLIVPLLDWLGYHLGMPWAYTLGTEIVRTSWYTNRVYMTPGIIIGWWITGYIVARVLRQRLAIGWSAIILISLTTFLVIFLPTYVFFTGLNTLFNRTFGLWFWNPQNYMFDSPSWFLQWGNGTYFALTAIIGTAYYAWQRKREDTA